MTGQARAPMMRETSEPPAPLDLMHDKFKKKHRAPRADDRVRRQIAREAARRLLPILAPEDGSPGPRDATAAEYYTAKRKAAAVLGHAVRPGDLPSDAEVREEALALARPGEAPEDEPMPEP